MQEAKRCLFTHIFIQACKVKNKEKISKKKNKEKNTLGL